MRTLILISILSSSAAFAQQDIGSRIADLAKARIDVESILDKRPYKEEEHKAIKNYFSKLNSMNEDLSTYPKYRKSLNSKVRSMGVEGFCKEIVLEKQRWNDLIKNCTRNNFFLCSEDVNDFAGIKAKLSSQLDSDLKSKFEQTSICN